MKFLRRPYPYHAGLTRRLAVAVGMGAFVGLFLFLFGPFGLVNVQPATFRLVICLGYGMATLLGVLLMNVAGPLLLPRYFNEDRWTVGREMASFTVLLLLIALLNMLYSAWLGFYEMSLGNFLMNLWFVLLIGMFPISMVIVLRQGYLQRRHQTEATVISQQMLQHPQPAHPAPLSLQGDGKKDTLTLPHADDLVLISAADNYCEVWVREGTEVRKRLLRASLKDLEQQLGTESPLRRVHRSHLAHLGQVEEVLATAQGLRLRLRGLEQEVPISRTYQEQIRALLEG